jgi:hypothetical protein
MTIYKLCSLPSQVICGICRLRAHYLRQEFKKFYDTRIKKNRERNVLVNDALNCQYYTAPVLD